MRLIDADALNKALNDRVDAINENRRKGATLPNIAWFSGMACAESIVEAQPTVDAVPVIRCKDCKYYRDGDCWHERDNDGRIYYQSVINEPTPDDYCSLGVRTEE